MKRNVIMCVLAGVALTAASPTLAKPGGGGGGGNGQGIGAGVGGGRGHSGAGANFGTSSDIGGATSGMSSISTRGKSANARTGFGSAIDMRSSSASGIASAQLTGVTTGMSVVDGDGATIGTVTNVTLTGGGKVKDVQVTLTDGTVIFLSPKSLTLDGSVLTTTSLTSTVKSRGADHANINGLIHASPRSALNRAGITTLTTLSTGMTVNDAGGASIGTISSLVVNRSGALVGIRVALTGGGTVLIPASTLSTDGTVVTTTFVPGG
jgi:hypothetical protein